MTHSHRCHGHIR